MTLREDCGNAPLLCQGSRGVQEIWLIPQFEQCCSVRGHLYNVTVLNLSQVFVRPKVARRNLPANAERVEAERN